jgi:hypothetical protein
MFASIENYYWSTNKQFYNRKYDDKIIGLGITDFHYKAGFVVCIEIGLYKIQGFKGSNIRVLVSKNLGRGLKLKKQLLKLKFFEIRKKISKLQ